MVTAAQTFFTSIYPSAICPPRHYILLYRASSLRPAHLYGGSVAGVEAVAHQHEQGVSHGTEHPHSLRVGHPQQAVVAHLQDAHAHLQTAVPRRRTARAHLQGAE